ncbi:MAG TPA: pitrilysin family protein [Acidobacteriota bacterium]|nr:pitrilysin family protein [Acidobacteriota bacterium]
MAIFVDRNTGPALRQPKRPQLRLRKIQAFLCLAAATVFAGDTLLAQQARVPDRSRLPQLEPPPALKLPPIQRLKLSNGLGIVLLEKHEVPVVAVSLLVKGGTALDPADRSGLANLTASLMTEGAGNRDALQLADEIDFLGAHISATAGYHAFSVNLYTPVSRLDQALPLLADVALRPTFPSEELERKRKQLLTRLLQARDEPSAIASVLFNRALYGSDHPYGVSPFLDEATIRAFTPEDARKFHASLFFPNNATLVVVGAVRAESLLPKLESSFGSWKPGQALSSTERTASQVRERAIYLVDKPGAPQSEIRVGQIGASRLVDDYFTLVTLNTILGGSFTSRLNSNLRENHGYTYGAGSSFGFRLWPGPFTIFTAVQTEVTDKALAEILKELEAIRQPIPAEELERGKNYVALRFPARFQSVRDIADQLEELIVYNLPDSYFNDYVRQILAVTPEAAQKAASRYLDPARVAIVVVGDRQRIEPALRALNIGPVKVLTVDEVMGRR